MRPLLGLLALALLGACGGATSPAAEAAPRTVSGMQPKLSHSLTPASTEATFGAPDESIGSGLIIYVYHAEAGRSVVLSFPGFEKIISARVREASGAVHELPLNP